MFRDTIRRGDTESILLTVTDTDLTNGKLWFTMKTDHSLSDANAALQLTSADALEIDIFDPTEGQARIFIDPEDSEDLDARDYYFDIQLKQSGGAIKTVLDGILEVKWDVTKSVN